MIIDLCCGIGTWEEESIGIDIDRKVRPTIQADVRFLPLRPGIKPKLCHASPPCLYISKARRWRWGWNPKGVAESLRLAAACFDAYDYLEAQNCTFEWPASFGEMLGEKISFIYDKADIKNATTNFFSNNKALKRARIPSYVRRAILDKLP